MTASWTGVAGILANGKYDVWRALVNGVESLVAVPEDYQLEGATLYTSALAYKDVVLVNNSNIPLYEMVDDADAITDATALSMLNVAEIAEGVFRVEIQDTDGKWIPKACIENLPVYHLVKKSVALNDYTGYWTEYNSLTKGDDIGAEYAYVVYAADGKTVAAIYVIDSQWDA